MRTARITLLLVLAVSTGCGSSGPEVPQFDAVAFFLGDPNVAAYGSALTFGGSGAPADGFVELLDPLDGDVLADIQDLDVGFALFLLLAFPDGVPAPQIGVTFDQEDCLVDGGPNSRFRPENRLKLLAPVEEDANGLLRAGSDILYHVGSGTAHVETLLSGPRRFGLAETRISVEARGEFNGSGWDFDVVVDQEDGSPVAADKVLILIGGSLIEDLGPLQEGTAQNLSTSFTVNEAMPTGPLEVFIETLQVNFFENLLVQFELDASPPPPMLTETRVQSAGLGNEGLWPMSRAMYFQVHPNEPVGLGLEDFALLLVGDHGMLQGKSTKSSGFVTTDSSAPRGGPGSKTYRGATIGLDPNAGNYVVADGATARQTQPVVAARLLVGDWGLSIANFDEVQGTFAADTVVDVGNMTDISPFDGNPMSGAAIYVDNSADAIKFITRDAQNQYVLDPAATLTNAAWPGASGKVVSAFRHASGDLLFVTDGEPGELWVVPSGASTATKVGDVAAAPRTVRAAGNIAAVGSFGGALAFGGLGLFVRSAAGSWGYAPFSRVGARSVGIDVKLLSDGRVAVASTSFFDDSLILTVLDNTTGEILDDREIALPAGCTAPGHCAFVPDPGVDGVFVSCNTSDNFVLMPVSFGP